MTSLWQKDINRSVIFSQFLLNYFFVKYFFQIFILSDVVTLGVKTVGVMTVWVTWLNMVTGTYHAWTKVKWLRDGFFFGEPFRHM